MEQLTIGIDGEGAKKVLRSALNDALDAAWPETASPLKRVAMMNEAFGNPRGHIADYPDNPEAMKRLDKQVSNIQDEFNEFYDKGFCAGNVKEMRDALCDIMVFAAGALHFLGVDADADMHAVIDGLYTRFIKDDADKAATVALHAARGVTDVYFEGEYPRMVMKSASDQPDAPRGKFLKSASYRNTVFPEAK